MNAQDLLLVGGGHTHVLLIRALAMRPIEGVRVTLVSEKALTPYSGMLPGYVAGHYTLEQTNIDLNRLCRLANIRWIRARVEAIDADRKEVLLQHQPALCFDKLSIDIGSTPDLSVKGAAEFAVGVKPISGFQARWATLLNTGGEQLQDVGNSHGLRDWGVIGAGAGGVELVLAMAYRMRHNSGVRFHLIYPGAQVLPGYPARMRTLAARQLRSCGVELHPGFSVIEVSQTGIVGNQGQHLALSESIWCTGATGASWLAGSSLDTDKRNFIKVSRGLQSISHESIFAVGDVAEVVEDPRPKAGVYAVRQAPLLEENLRRVFAGQAVREFSLQKQFLSLLSLGDRHAIASRNGLVVSGRWVWRWKDYIDRKFMRRFSELEIPKRGMQPAGQSSASDQMHCGGCGSKLGPALLLDNLRRIDADDPAGSAPDNGHRKVEDAAVWEPTPSSLMVQSIDGFRAFVSDEYLFARISVNHALNDIYAMGAEVTHAQAWINLAFSDARLQRRDHLRTLQGVVAALRAQQATLVGGHSTEGAEAHLAIVANGELLAAKWSKTGVQAGDVLVLSKALGTGVILAADMQAQAPAQAVGAALESMLLSNLQSMQCLREYNPHAVTDISGFGLLGHLLEMLNCSVGTAADTGNARLGAVLSLAAIPLIPGAIELARSGFRSTLYPQMTPYLAYCESTGALPGDTDTAKPDPAILDLLLDPQTSGGLLAALPGAEASRLVSDGAGFVVIGRIETRSADHLVRFTNQGETLNA